MSTYSRHILRMIFVEISHSKMWLEEMVLDGFKSYAHLTRIKPFDKSFTAITGLNGSGKSNIFDAICFVLGIS